MSLETQVKDVVFNFLKNACALNIDHNATNKSLAELGVDSFTLLELLFHLEQTFQVRLPAEQLNSDNISSLQAFIDTYTTKLTD